MNKKSIILVLIMILTISAHVYAMENMHMKDSKTVEVGNKICPISGKEIDLTDKIITQYEYEGKTYNFCCAGCIEEFKKNPQKYIKLIDARMASGKEINSGHEHTEHEHMMGEKIHHSMAKENEGKYAIKEEKTSESDIKTKEFDLEAYQFGYSPESITVSKGDVVKIRATSRDVPHGIFIREYGVNATLKKGEHQEIEFVADKAGEFDIICSVYCGRGHGNMKAKLVVKE